MYCCHTKGRGEGKMIKLPPTPRNLLYVLQFGSRTFYFNIICFRYIYNNTVLYYRIDFNKY